MVRKLITFTFFGILFLFSQSTCFAVSKHALLIGISDYADTGLHALEGPLNDVKLARAMLIGRFGFQEKNVVVLTDQAATHSGIESAFKNLAGRINPGDFVYIHYCGHGSLTPDMNGDEPGGKDQTWVSYGARKDVSQKPTSTPNKNDLDNFDILDDEIGQWLLPVYSKTDNVVFVSDSCHSAGVTRGEAPVTRAVPMDWRSHPLGNMKWAKTAHQTGIRVGAAKDDESAAEFLSGDGNAYGLFTWHWVKALYAVAPGETWHDVFKRTSVQITTRRGRSQHPRMEGEKRKTVFGADYAPMVKTVPVIRTMGSGSHAYARIQAGALQGVAKGSIYRLFASGDRKAGAIPWLMITKVKSFYSDGKVSSGPFNCGDLVVEESHAYPFEPIKLFLGADLNEDLQLLKNMAARIAALPGFATVKKQKDCDLVLYVLRPEGENLQPGTIQTHDFRHGPATLPKSYPNQPPEVWVLTPTERLFQKNLKISMADPGGGIDVLLANLKKIARIREIKQLESSPGVPTAITVKTVVMSPDDSCKAGPECITMREGSCYRKRKPLAASEMEGQILQKGWLVTFVLRNTSKQGYYCYVLDVSPDGKIKSIFPHPDESAENALLKAGGVLDLSERVVLMLETRGEETIKLIATKDPIDVHLLEQAGFRTRRNKQPSPLERLLSSAIHGTRRGTVSHRVGQWETLQFSFEVE